MASRAKPASPRWKAVLDINHIEQRVFQYTHTGGWEECIGVLSWLVWRAQVLLRWS